MATLEEFYQWLVNLFKEGEHHNYEDIKQKMEHAGYDDVTAHDVYNAVNTMIDDGDVFNSEQSSSLAAYTGGNHVDQGAYAPATTSIGSPGATTATYHAPPPPPPLDPEYGVTDLDAAIRQIVYVNNVSNNTYTEDNDYFSDDDVVVDSSVNQTILANGDVNQDFDTVTATGQAVANSGEITDSAVIGGGVEDSLVAGDDAYLEGSAVGDNNTILNDSDGSNVGDGNTAIYGSNVAGPVASGGGDAIQAEQIAGGDAIQTEGNVNTGSGDQINAENSLVGGGDVTGNTGNMVNSGIESGEGDLQAIQGSAVEAAAFGSGSTQADDVHIEDSAGVGVTTGDYSDSDGEFEQTHDEQYVNIEDSAGVGVADEGHAEGEFEPKLEIEVGDEENDLAYEM